jgi:hypothetical protein
VPQTAADPQKLRGFAGDTSPILPFVKKCSGQNPFFSATAIESGHPSPRVRSAGENKNGRSVLARVGSGQFDTLFNALASGN